jgi:flap endonuclease-1
MGIKGLGKLLARYVTKITVPIMSLSDTSMAIDVYNYLYRIWYIAQTKVITNGSIEPDRNAIIGEVSNMIYNFINKLTYYRIRPVFVFEGKAHSEKSVVQEKRRKIKMKYKDKIQHLKEVLDTTPLVTVDTPNISDRIYTVNTVEVISDDIVYNTQSIDEELKNLYCRTIDIYQKDINVIRSMLLKNPNVTVLNAKYEAEQLCSSLYIEDKVQSVYSTDTDNLVYGCGLLLTNMDEYGLSFIGYTLQEILVRLDLSMDEFRELCILMGCDYNTNIRGIGPIKSYQLIRKYGSIDKLPRTYDTSCLNYKRCRDIFKYIPSVDLIL